MNHAQGRRRDSQRWTLLLLSFFIYLPLGQVYGFAAFRQPMTRLLGITRAVPADWKAADLGWIFPLALASLGLAAALGAAWVERAGPRKALLSAAAFLAGGLFLAALGVRRHSLPLVHLGYGLFAGIGMGLGFTTPLKALLAWIPARPGLASGLSILGFGAGGWTAAYGTQAFLARFRTPTSLGVWETFAALAALSLAILVPGACLLRLPPQGFGRARAAKEAPAALLRSRTFGLLWMMLFLLAAAGTGVLGRTAALAHDLFPGRHGLAGLDPFGGLLGLCHLAGALAWGWASDGLGRRAAFALLLGGGAALFILTAAAARHGGGGLALGGAALEVSLYGGGFALLPAYVRDHFGPDRATFVYGRLLTAWSAAALAAPALVGRLREFQVESGLAPQRACLLILYLASWLLVLGFTFNHALGGAGRPSGPVRR